MKPELLRGVNAYSGKYTMPAIARARGAKLNPMPAISEALLTSLPPL